MPSYDSLFNAFVTILVTIDPPGLAPLFLAVTRGMNRDERRQVSVRASIIGFAVMALFARRRRGHPVGVRHHAAGLPRRRRLPAVLHRLRDGLREAAGPQGKDLRRRHHQGHDPQHRGLSAGHPADRRPRRHLRHGAAVRLVPGPGRARPALVGIIAVCLVPHLSGLPARRAHRRHSRARPAARS